MYTVCFILSKTLFPPFLPPVDPYQQGSVWTANAFSNNTLLSSLEDVCTSSPVVVSQSKLGSTVASAVRVVENNTAWAWGTAHDVVRIKRRWWSLWRT